MLRLAVAVLAALVAVPAAAQARPALARPATSPTSPVCVPRQTAAPAGLTLLASDPVKNHPRVTDLTFASKALNGKVHADVLLPAGYDPHGRTRYPVLYLLHGHGGNHTDWVNHGVEQAIGNLPVIVVMPDGGYDGFYSDWYGVDADGHTPSPAPGWETFHLRELLPWVDATLHTVADRRGRAIAGLSMGGFGAMSYAARHPDLFVAAGSFSGAVDIDYNYPFGGTALTAVANVPDGKQPDLCIWGDPLTQDVVWRDHNPTELARNLSGLSLYLTSGNGLPGRYDPAQPNPGASAIEFGVFLMTGSLDKALTAAGVPHATNFYGPGTHSWPYWVDDLKAFVPRMAAAFAAAPPAPTSGTPFSFESAASPFSVWGWTFTPHRDVSEMTYLRSVTARGFRVAGSGLLGVATAPLYRPGATYRVTGARSRSLRVKADRAGRLHFDVDLGPSHILQQYAFGPLAEASFTHAKVAVTPL